MVYPLPGEYPTQFVDYETFGGNFKDRELRLTEYTTPNDVSLSKKDYFKLNENPMKQTSCYQINQRVCLNMYQSILSK